MAAAIPSYCMHLITCKPSAKLCCFGAPLRALFHAIVSVVVTLAGAAPVPVNSQNQLVAAVACELTCTGDDTCWAYQYRLHRDGRLDVVATASVGKFNYVATGHATDLELKFAGTMFAPGPLLGASKRIRRGTG